MQTSFCRRSAQETPVLLAHRWEAHHYLRLGVGGRGGEAAAEEVDDAERVVHVLR